MNILKRNSSHCFTILKITIIALTVILLGLSIFQYAFITNAQIENALVVDPSSHDFGIVSPQESLSKNFSIALSDSFLSENRVDAVSYFIRKKPKCKTFQENGECVEYYPDLCPYLSQQSQPEEDAFGELKKSVGDVTDNAVNILKVPCFEGLCAQGYDPNIFGAPLPLKLNGATFGCDLWVEVSGVATSSISKPLSAVFQNFPTQTAYAFEAHIIGVTSTIENRNNPPFLPNQPSAWTTFDMHGAAGTYAHGISGNNIVGEYYYKDSMNNAIFNGFIYNGTNWITLNAPGANGTFLTDIEDNNIVGYYYDISKEGSQHMFLYNGTNWTTFNSPDGTWGIPLGVSGNNIVGYYRDGSTHGFLYNGTSWTTLDVPGAPGTTYAEGIYGNNIVGHYWDGEQNHGFLYNGTIWTTLDAPGANDTFLTDIKDNNIIGYYNDATGKPYHGFLYNGTTWTTLDAPGATGTYAEGIYGNNIVGHYRDSSGPHGFLYEMSPNQPPILSFPIADPYTENGINPNKGTVETEFTFKTVYTDANNDAPQNISLIVGDGTATTTRALILDASASTELRDGNYANGEQFTATSTFSKKAKYFYHFETSDGKGGTARMPETDDLQFSVINVPVIIVPGIMGSYLNLDSTWEQIWLDLTDGEIPNAIIPKEEIFLNDLGESINAISASGIIKETPKIPGIVDAVDIFDSLIKELNIYGYDNSDVFFFPYDWRLDNSFNATENHKTSLSNLKSAINIISEATNSKTVDIIAHSMGGLLVKKYIAEQTLIGEKSGIDKLIFIGVPHLGAPKSAAILLEGHHPLFESSILNFISANSIKKLSRNMIPIYQLLPSRAYIESNSEKYIYVHPGLLNKIFHYFSETGWLNYDQTKQFINTELEENKMTFLESADYFHQEIDNLNIPALGIKTYNIEGCGKETIGGIKYKLKYVFSYGAPVLPYYVSHDLEYVNGDGTVPFLSANSIQSKQYFYARNASHMQLPSSDGIPNLIATILQDKLSSFNYPSHISATPIGDNGNFCDFSGTALSVHSPIELHIYDSQNNHAGPTENGHIENNIPNAQYNFIGDEKFVFLPSETTYRIIGIATNTGAFDLRIAEIEKSKIVTTTYFDRIPIITANLRFTFNITPRQHLRALQIDQNGDSLFESEITPTSILTAKESDDLSPPETSISINGSKGKNDWYVSDVKVGFSTTDDNSGILKTEYSLDNGQTWSIYQQPFTISTEGTTTILYLSIDRAGNYELLKSQIIKIDKTPPEAKIFFDQNLKQLNIEGVDNLSPVVMTQNGIIYTLTDDAGHTLAVDFDKLKTEGKEIKSEIRSLRYDNILAPSTPENKLQYEWSLEKSGDIKELNQRIEVEKTFDVRARYDRKKNETIIDTKMGEEEKSNQTFQGFTALILTTNSGNFDVKYNQ